ncbi:hypothetical protein HCQ94_01975 [Actinomyces sp. zg-332]|uniref:hypothetical protein n=1 Tax=Actinomyces sp. zg-332 TaxID=2708340 RepID=UPI00141F8DB2|nr:hypothetical protein [Actinomyces sp. zg-332]QPK94499.1 hypothetical protein HCQ94_01975 [Actinomyces sp. zg-332]
MVDDSIRDGVKSISHNDRQMLKAVRKIFTTMLVLLVTILVFGSLIAYYFDGFRGIESVLLATLGFIVLMSVTILVIKLSVKNHSLIGGLVLFAFLIKIIFIIVFLFLIRNYMNVNAHIFSITLIISMLLGSFIEIYFLTKTKFRYV